MTPLEKHLRGRISEGGPLTVEQFMADALGHPTFGYYMTRDPFGERGDFTTAPEVSQIFGELIGAWLASMWLGMGAPSPVNLIELGPGRGTLMSDALRAVRGVPGFCSAIRVSLVETSPVLRERQKSTLRGAAVDSIDWHDDITQCHPGPSLVVANEFFDALPVRQFERKDGNWYERMVGSGVADGELAFMLADDAADPALLLPGLECAANGDLVEISAAGRDCMRNLAARLVNQGGAALIIDYGHTETAVGDTLQALRGHHYANVLEAPGEQDLTTHVDFAELARVATDVGARSFGPTTQAAFLSRLGIDIRLQRLLGKARDDRAASALVAGARRLIDAGQMGELFKVLAVTSMETAEPAGF